MTFIDTPGFGADMKRVLSQCLQAATSEGATTSGVIYLHRITDPDAESASRAKLDMFRKFCGKKLQNVILCTTMWEDLGIAKGEVRERRLREDSTLWGDMHKEGALVRRLQGLDFSASARGISETLVKNMLAALEIQVELENKVPLEASTGELWIGGAEREAVKRKQTKEIDKLIDELRAASTTKGELITLMEEMKRKLTEEVEKLKAEPQQAAGTSKDEAFILIGKLKSKYTDEIKQPWAEERAASTAKEDVFALKEEIKGKHTEVRLLETTDRLPSAQSQAQLLWGIALVCLFALGSYYAVFCTTMWEKSGAAEGAVREQRLRGDSTLRGDMFGEGEGALIRRHQGPDSSAPTRGIAETLAGDRLAALQIQVESESKASLEASVGKLRTREVEVKVKGKHKGGIEKLMAVLQAASTVLDEAVPLMEEMKRKLTEEVEWLWAELQAASTVKDEVVTLMEDMKRKLTEEVEWLWAELLAAIASKDEALAPMKKIKGKRSDEIEQPRAEEGAPSTAKNEVFALKEMKEKPTEEVHIEEVHIKEVHIKEMHIEEV